MKVGKELAMNKRRVVALGSDGRKKVVVNPDHTY
jgi:hypothetical protein